MQHVLFVINPKPYASQPRKPENLLHLARSLHDAGGATLCLADGGFSDKARRLRNPAGGLPGTCLACRLALEPRVFEASSPIPETDT